MKGVLASVGLLLLGHSSHAADTVRTVNTSATADLTNPANYNGSGALLTTNDLLFGSSAYTTLAYTINGSLSVGTLNDADTTQSLTIDNTSGTADTLTLNSSGNNLTGTTGAASSSDLIFVKAGANLNIGSSSNANLAISVLNNGNFDNAGTLTIGSSSPITVASTKTLSFTGAGTTTLNSTITATGATVAVNAGTLKLGATGGLATGTAFNTGSGGTFDLNGVSQSLGTVTNNGTITNTGAAATLTFGAGYVSASTGTVTGALNLILNSAGGTLSFNNSTLNNSGTINDTITTTGISATVIGTVGGGASGNVTEVIESSAVNNLTVNNLVVAAAGTKLTNSSSGRVLSIGSVTGIGNLTLNTTGPQAISLTGNINNTGSINITAGTILDSGTANLTMTNTNAENWAGNLTFVGSNNLNLGAGAITMAAPLTLTVTAKTLTVNGVIGGTTNGVFDLTKAGAGTLVIGENIALGANQVITNSNIAAGTETFAGVISDGGHGYGLTMASTNTLGLSGTSTYSGATTVSTGTLSLIGNTGSVASSTISVNNGTTLLFDDTAVGATGNGSRAASVILNGATGSNLNVTAAANTGANTVDTITGALSIGAGASGASTVTLTPNTATTPLNTQLVAGSFARSSGSEVLFRGANLGVNSIASQTAGATNIKFNTAPTLIGNGGAAGSTTISIIAGAYGDTLATGTGLDATGGLVTYDATNGVRLLNTATEYTTGITNGQTQLDNVRITNSGTASTTTLGSNTTINSLSLLASGNTSAITINGGGTLKLNSGAIYAVSSGTSNNTHGITIANTIDLNGQEGTIFDATVGGSGGSNLFLTGAITNGGGLTIAGSGVVTMSGTAANTYTGTTTVDGGTLQLNKTGVNAIAGDIVLNAGTVSMVAGNQIADTSNVTVNGGQFSGSSDTYNNLTVNGGTYSPGSNVVLNGTATITGGTSTAGTSGGNAGSLTASGLISFVPGTSGGGTLTVQRSGGTGVFNSLLVANGGLSFTNTASGAYTPITISAGTSAGNMGGAIVLGANAGVTFVGNSTNSNTLSIAAPSGVGGTGVTELNGANSFNIGDGAAAIDMTISTPFTEAASGSTFFKDGAGTLLVNGGPSSYTGGTVIDAGTLLLGGSATLGTTNMASNPFGVALTGGTLDLGGTSQVVSAVFASGVATIQNGSITASDPSAPNYTITNATGTVKVSANLLDSGFSGGVPLTMNGTGTLLLAGTNTYAGPTTVNAGTLIVSGSTAAASAVAINAGATLAGAGAANEGTLNGTVTVASGAPGGAINLRDGAIGTLHVGGLTVNGGTLSFDIGAGASGNLDSIASVGTLTIGGATTITLGYLSGTPTLTNGTYSLITYNNGGSALGSTAFGNLTLNASALSGSGKTFSLLNNAGNLELVISTTTTTTGTTYTLTTSAGSTLLHAGESTALTTTLTNTGGAGTDTLAYSGVGASSTLGTVSGATISSPPTLANGGGTTSNTNQTLTTTAGTAGVATISSTGTMTNGTIGGAASGAPTGTSVTVYSGLMNYTGGSGGTWVNGNFTDTQNSAVHVAPGLDSNYQSTDTVTFGTGAGGTVDLGNATPSLKAVTFNNATSYNLTTTGSGALVLNGGAGNASVSVTTGSHTISAPIILGSNTSIVPASGTQLNVSGQISGTGKSLNQTGAGTTILSSATGNTYTGGTTVSLGKLYANNTSGSGTGTGSVAVVSGGTLAGSGTIKPTGGAGVTISNGATLASGANQSNYAVVNGGNGSVNGTGTGGGLTLDNTETSSSLLNIAGGAQLTFALGSATAYNGGSGALNYANPNTNSTFLNITGNTVDQIFATSTLAINIHLIDLTYGAPNGGVALTLRSQNPYLLIETALGNNNDFSNLVTTGGTGANGLVLGVSNGAGGYTPFTLGAYDINGNLISSSSNLQNLQLYLYNGDLEVVPEPGTWVMMLGGIALLVVIQRRRRNG